MPSLDAGVEQDLWERRHRALRAHETGSVTYRQIGKMLDISADRVRQITNKARWERSMGWQSPAEDYLEDKIGLFNMARKAEHAS